MEIIPVLEEVGLTKSETRVYLALNELGETKVGALITETGLQSSVVHNALNSLMKKGFLSYVNKGKIKHYMANPPSVILDLLDRRKDRVKEIIPIIEKKRKNSGNYQNAAAYEGLKSVIGMINQLLKETKKGEKHYFFASNVDVRNKQIQDFFHRYDAKRIEAGFDIKGIAPHKLKKYFENRKLNVRFTNFPIPSNISIWGNNVAIISWSENPIGFVLRSPQIASMFTFYFEEIWKIS